CAAIEVVLSGRRSTRRVDSIEGSQKVRQCGRELDLISYRLNARRRAAKPSVHRPRPRIAAAGSASGQGLRDGQRQMAGEEREPSLLLVDLRDVALGAWQAHRHLFAEPEGRVVIPVDLKPRA